MGGVAGSLRRYCAIWGIAMIQKTREGCGCFWGPYGDNFERGQNVLTCHLWERGNSGGILRDDWGEGNCESKIAARQWESMCCRETFRCLAEPSGEESSKKIAGKCFPQRKSAIHLIWGRSGRGHCRKFSATFREISATFRRISDAIKRIFCKFPRTFCRISANFPQKPLR